MPNFAVVLKDEIRRLAKKEARTQTAKAKRLIAQHRRDIAELKRIVQEMRRKVAFLEAQERERVAKPQVAATEVKGRFSPRWLAAHRRKLGLSAADYGKLLGVSGQSVYLWERGKVKPRKEQMATFLTMRRLKKREAATRLEMLNAARPGGAEQKPGAKRGRKGKRAAK